MAVFHDLNEPQALCPALCSDNLAFSHSSGAHFEMLLNVNRMHDMQENSKSSAYDAVFVLVDQRVTKFRQTRANFIIVGF